MPRPKVCTVMARGCKKALYVRCSKKARTHRIGTKKGVSTISAYNFLTGGDWVGPTSAPHTAKLIHRQVAVGETRRRELTHFCLCAGFTYSNQY